MKKFIGFVDDLVPDACAGLAMAHPELLAVNPAPLFVHRRQGKQDRVALVSGGGSGHEPLHVGYVGLGMLDAACPGQVFTSPHPDQIAMAAEHVHAGQGVLLIAKSYAGDLLNFEKAAEMLSIEHAMIVVDDDVTVGNGPPAAGRRGIAGTLVVEKMVGAAAERGDDLRRCQAIGQRVNGCTASMGVAFTACVVPEAAAPTFEIGDSEMEVGVGIHGEPGRYRRDILPAEDIVELLLEGILRDLHPARGQEVLLHVNGFGATPMIELYLLNKLATQALRDRGLAVVRWLVGNHTTSLDTAGASLTVTLLDDELKALWDAPVHTGSLRWGA
ncbi:MAG TPA: dihydroxyacetone kinase subunit DhaK [Burkholderiaceae bacterium]